MLKKQRGLTMITWMLVIGLVAIQAVMAMRIIPVYLNYNSVKHIMDAMPATPGIRGKSAPEIRKYITKQLSINSLYDLAKNKDAFKFTKTKEGMALVLHYEERGVIIGNLEFVATFDHEVILSIKE